MTRLAAALLALALVPLFAATPASANGSSRGGSEVRIDHDNNPDTFPEREFAGQNRYETAVALASNYVDRRRSSASFCESRDDCDTSPVSAVVVASGESLIDAAAAAGIASALEAPVLLIPKDAGNGAEIAVNFIKENGMKEVVILGGTAAVSEAAAGLLRRIEGVEKVERIGGTNRFDTAAQIARRASSRLPSSYCGEVGRAAILAVGDGADLAHISAAGPLSFAAGIPILLTSAGGLPAETLSAISRLDVKHVLTVGNVPSDVDVHLSGAGVTKITRLAGDASTASVAIVKELERCDRKGFNWASGWLALVSSDGLPDGISAAPYLGRDQLRGAGFSGGPTVWSLTPTATMVLIVNRDSVPPVVLEFLREYAQREYFYSLSIWAIGGEAAISSATVEKVILTINEALPDEEN